MLIFQVFVSISPLPSFDVIPVLDPVDISNHYFRRNFRFPREFGTYSYTVVILI